MTEQKDRAPQSKGAETGQEPFAGMDPTVRPGGVFMVRLLMKEPCELPPPETLQSTLQKHMGRINFFGSEDPDKGFVGFAALDHLAKFKDAEGPAMFTLQKCEPFDAGSIDEMHRSQLWDIGRDREAVLAECRYMVTAFDMMGGGIEPLERADLLMDFLEALVELFPACEAVYCLNSGKMLPPQVIREGRVQGLKRFIKYVVNVRFFNIQGSNDHVVDTLGLSLLYLEDLQYYFHDMDPNWVVEHAYNVACYILENRRPIKEGDTIDGIVDGRIVQEVQWPCHFMEAMIGPGRPVLDIEMGEYASGERGAPGQEG